MACRAILDSDTRRPATHITYLRLDALTGTRGREHRLLPLEIGERLFSNEKRQPINNREPRCGNRRTVTRLGFNSISEADNGIRR